MQGIAAFPGRVEPDFVDIPEPRAPGPGQVLCRTLQLGVCGTDRDILQSTTPFVPPGENFLVLGHECLARVEAVGPDVPHLRSGDLVVPTVRRSPPHARHRVDLLNFGDYTERGIVALHGFSAPWWVDDPQYLYQVQPDLAAVAVLTEPLAVAEKGLHEAQLLQEARCGANFWTEAPPRVLVTGLGPIAFAGILASVARGWPTTVYGRDSVATFRATLAQRLGANYLPAESVNLAPQDVEKDGFDLILECTGSDAVTVELTGTLASRGICVWLGSSRLPNPAPHNVALMMRNGLLRNHLHLGSVNAAPRDFEQALLDLAWWQLRQPQTLAALLTDHVAPRDSLEHYLTRKTQGIKTVLHYDNAM